jgi:hypothetical protein
LSLPVLAETKRAYRRLGPTADLDGWRRGERQSPGAVLDPVHDGFDGRAFLTDAARADRVSNLIRPYVEALA